MGVSGVGRSVFSKDVFGVCVFVFLLSSLGDSVSSCSCVFFVFFGISCIGRSGVVGGDGCVKRLVGVFTAGVMADVVAVLLLGVPVVVIVLLGVPVAVGGTSFVVVNVVP